MANVWDYYTGRVRGVKHWSDVCLCVSSFLFLTSTEMHGMLVLPDVVTTDQVASHPGQRRAS